MSLSITPSASFDLKVRFLSRLPYPEADFILFKFFLPVPLSITGANCLSFSSLLSFKLASFLYPISPILDSKSVPKIVNLGSINEFFHSAFVNLIFVHNSSCSFYQSLLRLSNCFIFSWIQAISYLWCRRSRNCCFLSKNIKSRDYWGFELAAIFGFTGTIERPFATRGLKSVRWQSFNREWWIGWDIFGCWEVESCGTGVWWAKIGGSDGFHIKYSDSWVFWVFIFRYLRRRLFWFWVGFWHFFRLKF